MRRRALLMGGAGKKVELYLTTTNSQASNYIIAIDNPKDSRQTFIVRDVLGNELMRVLRIGTSGNVTFNFSGLTGIREIYYEVQENKLDGITRIQNINTSTDIFDRKLDVRLTNIQTFIHRGSAISIGQRGIDGIPLTWSSLHIFEVRESANSSFSIIGDFDFTQFLLTGQNTVSLIPPMPNVTNFILSGQNTVSEIPPMPNCTHFELRGQNTVSSIPPMPNVQSLSIQGNSAISQLTVDFFSDFNFPKLTFVSLGSTNVNSLTTMSYTGRRTFPENMRRFAVYPRLGGLTEDGDQVANLIIDLAQSTWIDIGVNGQLNLLENCKPPTPSPELTDAIAYLTSVGVAVNTN